MAGAGTTYFTAQKEKHQGEADSLEQQLLALEKQSLEATAKLHQANDALNLLAKATLTQDEAESLIGLYQKLS